MSSINIDFNLKQLAGSKLKTESIQEEKTFTKRMFNYIWSWIPCVGSYTHVEDVEPQLESEDDSLQHSESETSNFLSMSEYEESSSEEQIDYEWTVEKRLDFIKHLCTKKQLLIKQYELEVEESLKSKIDEESSNLEQSSSKQLKKEEDSPRIILSHIDEDVMKCTKVASSSESREAVYTAVSIIDVSKNPIYTDKIDKRETEDYKYLSLKVEENTFIHSIVETLSKEDYDLDIDVQTHNVNDKIELNTNYVRTNDLTEKINEVYLESSEFALPTEDNTLLTNEIPTSLLSSAKNDNIFESSTYSENIEDKNLNIEAKDQKIGTIIDNQSSIYLPTNHQRTTDKEPKRNLPDRQFSFKELFKFYESKK